MEVTHDYVGMRLTAPQTRHFLMNCRFPLFVGGYGSGKTTSMIARAVSDLLENPGVNIGLYEPTFDLLKLSLIPRLEQLLQEMRVRYHYQKADHILHVSGYGSLICRSLDNPNRLISYEVFRSHIDELDTLGQRKAEDVWTKVVARQRQKSPVNPDAPNRCSVYTTPEGFRFTYSRWGREQNEAYKYVRVDSRSNPYLPADYIDSLFDSYPEELAKAYIMGQWVNLTSGTCYYAFDRSHHHRSLGVTERDVLHVGVDFNVYKMAATINIEREEGSYSVDEVYGVRDTPDMCIELKKRYPNNKIIVYPDASGSRQDTRSKKSDHQLIRDHGFTVRSRSKNTPFSSRALAVNKRFQDLRHFVDVDACPMLVEGLEHQVYASDGFPDKSQDLDHAPDSLGYYIGYRFPVLRGTLVEKELQ